MSHFPALCIFCCCLCTLAVHMHDAAVPVSVRVGSWSPLQRQRFFPPGLISVRRVQKKNKFCISKFSYISIFVTKYASHDLGPLITYQLTYDSHYISSLSNCFGMFLKGSFSMFAIFHFLPVLFRDTRRARKKIC